MNRDLTPEQLAKLPKYAQDHIADLKRQIADIQRVQDRAQWKDSPVQSGHNMYPGGAHGLDPQIPVRFAVQHGVIEVRRTEDDVLQVHGDWSLAITAQSSNVVTLELVDPIRKFGPRVSKLVSP